MNRALQWKLIAGFVLVFIAGGVTGAFFGGHYARNHIFRAPHRGFLKERMGERLRVELKLTPEQVAKIAPIIDRSTEQLETIRTETARRVHQTMKQAHEEMAVSLTDEQREKLKKIQFRHRRHLRRFQERNQPPAEDPQQ